MKKEIQIQISTKKWENFKTNCQANGSTAEETLNQFIRYYNKKNQNDEFDFDRALQELTKERKELLDKLS